jgi:hypothetical protein
LRQLGFTVSRRAFRRPPSASPQASRMPSSASDANAVPAQTADVAARPPAPRSRCPSAHR